MNRDDVEVILEFPTESKSQDAKEIKKEIKEILASELQEKIRQIIEVSYL